MAATGSGKALKRPSGAGRPNGSGDKTSQQETVDAVVAAFKARDQALLGGGAAKVSEQRQALLAEYPGAFGVQDLVDTAEDLERGVEFPVPGSRGKRVWVYGMSPEDAQDQLVWVRPFLRAHTQRLGGKSEEDQQYLSTVLQVDYQVLQVIACTRVGPKRGHPRAFDPEHSILLKKHLGLGVVAQICRISDELSHSFDPVQEAIAAFFTDAQSFFSTLSSALSTGGPIPSGLLEQASDLASRAGRLTTPEGRWSAHVT